MPFDLHPEYPPEGIPREQLEQRYGHRLRDRLNQMFDQAGLPHQDRIEKVPRSLHALMLSELARDRGVFADVHVRLFDAYWARGLDIGDQDVLLAEAGEVGLSRSDVVQALDNDDYRERVRSHTASAVELGAGGVPAWLIDEKVLVPGAQPYQVFDRVLQRMGHQPLRE